MGYYNAITIVISSLALFVTVVRWWLDKRMKKSNRELIISAPLYEKHLLHTIPEAFEEFVKSKNVKRAGLAFSMELKNIEMDLYYFKYTRPKIHKMVIDSLSELDKLIMKAFENSDDGVVSEEIQIKMVDALDNIFKAFLYDLPDDRIDQYFRLH